MHKNHKGRLIRVWPVNANRSQFSQHPQSTTLSLSLSIICVNTYIHNRTVTHFCKTKGDASAWKWEINKYWFICAIASRLVMCYTISWTMVSFWCVLLWFSVRILFYFSLFLHIFQMMGSGFTIVFRTNVGWPHKSSAWWTL